MLREGTYLVVTPFFPSKESHHGTYIYDQINEIRNQTNFDIKVIKTVSLSSLELDYEYDGFQVFVLRNINIPFFIFPGLFNFINKSRILGLLDNQNISDVAIVHGHVTYPSAFLSNCIADKFKCKSIIQHHGLDVLQLMHGRVSSFRKLQRRYIIRKGLNELNKIDLNIGVSNRVLAELNNFTRYEPKAQEVLYNGVDTFKFFPKKNQDIQYYTIGCIANFYRSKDHITLIKAVHRLIQSGKKIKLKLIGSGTTLNFCKEYVDKHKISNDIYFLGYKNHIEMNSFYNSIDLFVLPSYYEALGCVYLEAWATQTPFIGVRSQGISELAPMPDYMLINKKDVISLQEKIVYFMDSDIVLEFDQSLSIRNTIQEFLEFNIFDL